MQVPTNEALARTRRPKENLARQGQRVLPELQDSLVSLVSQGSRVNRDSRLSRAARDRRPPRSVGRGTSRRGGTWTNPVRRRRERPAFRACQECRDCRHCHRHRERNGSSPPEGGTFRRNRAARRENPAGRERMVSREYIFGATLSWPLPRGSRSSFHRRKYVWACI